MMPDTNATEIWAADAEWAFAERRINHESAWTPVVLCLVGLHSGNRMHFWGRDPRLLGWFRDHRDDLFVAHNAVAEMKYLLRLQVPLPARWYDTFAAWRCLSNRPGHLEAGLSVALGEAGLPRLAPAEKTALQERVLHLDFDADDPRDRREITGYCYSDCDGCLALYRQIADKLDPATMTHWMAYTKAVARMELQGIPFDVTLYRRVVQHRHEIRRALIGNTNATWPVYHGDTFNKHAFLAFCNKSGITWPLKRSPATKKPYRPLDNETLKEMEHRHPFIARVRQVQKTLNSFKKQSLTVDPATGRHYFSTNVFRSVTGRNQPINFVFSGPKWLRFLILPKSPEHVLVYVDYIAQEFGIAAALSGDPAMAASYAEQDCHLAFAARAGAAPPGATKQTHAQVRHLYKTVNLGVLYGQTEFGIAARLGIHRHEAQQLLDEHKRLYRVFWSWSERVVDGAYNRRWITTPCGWRAQVPLTSNERTWANWPMQATASDIMRLTVTYLDRQNVRLLAIVHDGFLLSCQREQLPDLREAVDYACSTAVEHVLPGFQLSWDVTVHTGRFEDEDGRALWNQLQDILAKLETSHATAEY